MNADTFIRQKQEKLHRFESGLSHVHRQNTSLLQLRQNLSGEVLRVIDNIGLSVEV